MSTHLVLLPHDPAGFQPRRWRCKACGELGSPGALMRSPCPVPYKAGDQERALLDAIKGNPDGS